MRESLQVWHRSGGTPISFTTCCRRRAASKAARSSSLGIVILVGDLEVSRKLLAGVSFVLAQIKVVEAPVESIVCFGYFIISSETAAPEVLYDHLCFDSNWSQPPGWMEGDTAWELEPYVCAEDGINWLQRMWLRICKFELLKALGHSGGTRDQDLDSLEMGTKALSYARGDQCGLGAGVKERSHLLLTLPNIARLVRMTRPGRLTPNRVRQALQVSPLLLPLSIELA
ncbi:hypothetical protein TKK_0008145 [Trichogramma kaykai]